MTDMIANSLCSLINRAFPHLVAFVSSVSGGAVVAATLGIVIALVLGYRGLQYAVNSEHAPRKKARRVRGEHPQCKSRCSIFTDNEVFDASWMVEDKWVESR